MSNPITVAQLEQYRQQIRSGGVDGAAQVYASLYAQGYNYAGWAGGVAEGNTLSGVGALSFIQGNTLDYSGGVLRQDTYRKNKRPFHPSPTALDRS